MEGTSLYDEALDEPIFQESTPQPEEPQEDPKVYSLLYNGHLTDTFSIGTREITIRTLKIGEELEASLVADRWKDSGDAGRALATALVAAAIVSIDGEPLIQGLGPRDETLQSKFDYIRKNWYWINVKAIYSRYDLLVGELLAAYDQLKKD